MRKTSTRITVETERLFSISRPRSIYALCEACGDEVRFVTVNEATRNAGVNSLTIYRLAEAGRLHYAETGAGELLLCAVSLANFTSTQVEGEV
jgi:hypothetical protein